MRHSHVQFGNNPDNRSEARCQINLRMVAHMLQIIRSLGRTSQYMLYGELDTISCSQFTLKFN